MHLWMMSAGNASYWLVSQTLPKDTPESQCSHLKYCCPDLQDLERSCYTSFKGKSQAISTLTKQTSDQKKKKNEEQRNEISSM